MIRFGDFIVLLIAIVFVVIIVVYGNPFTTG